MQEGLLQDMMAVYAAALSWPELATPATFGVLTMDIFVSGIFPVSSPYRPSLLGA